MLSVVVELTCSTAAPCSNITFKDVNIAPLNGTARYVCQNVMKESGFSVLDFFIKPYSLCLAPTTLQCYWLAPSECDTCNDLQQVALRYKE